MTVVHNGYEYTLHEIETSFEIFYRTIVHKTLLNKYLNEFLVEFYVLLL